MFGKKYGKGIFNLRIEDKLDKSSTLLKLINDDNSITRKKYILYVAELFNKLSKEGWIGNFIVTDKNYLLKGSRGDLEQKIATLDLDANYDAIMEYPIVGHGCGSYCHEAVKVDEPQKIHIHYEDGKAANLVKKNGELMLE